MQILKMFLTEEHITSEMVELAAMFGTVDLKTVNADILNLDPES